MNLHKLNRMEFLAFKNALRLHDDSILLYRKKSYPSAFALSILAAEEYGKASWLQHFSYYWHDYDDKWKNTLLLDTYSHITKQTIFQNDIASFLKSGKFTTHVPHLESSKQNAIYVGLPRKKKTVNLKGKIIVPFAVSAKLARRQITALNDLLLDLAFGIRDGYYSWDTFEVERMMNGRLIRRLTKSWPFSSRSAVRKFKTRYSFTTRRTVT
jgi:AbiV family abortive infection protein